MANLRHCIESAVDRVKRDFNDHPSPMRVPFGKDHFGKDYPLKSLSEWIDELKKRKLLHYDKHSKEISVTCDFRFGTIPKIKIIASREQWYEIYYSINQQTFNSIQEFLSRPTKQGKEKLKRYAKKDLTSFRDDLFNCAVAAHSINPVQYYRKGKYYRYKKRKSSSYKHLSRDERNEISNRSILLYTYFRLLSKTPQEKWRPFVKKFLEAYEIPMENLNKNVDNKTLQDNVKDVMLGYYGDILYPAKANKISERFWHTFVTDRHISLKRFTKLNLINLETKPLLVELFKEFIN